MRLILVVQPTPYVMYDMFHSLGGTTVARLIRYVALL